MENDVRITREMLFGNFASKGDGIPPQRPRTSKNGLETISTTTLVHTNKNITDITMKIYTAAVFSFTNSHLHFKAFSNRYICQKREATTYHRRKSNI